MRNRRLFQFIVILLSFAVMLAMASCNHVKASSGSSSGPSVSGSETGLNPDASIRVWFTMNTTREQCSDKNRKGF